MTLLGTAGTAPASDLPACPSSGYLHNCFGTHTFAPNSKWAGNKYVGEFRDNTFHGQGTYYHASGSKYVGEFRDGQPNGQGAYYSLADNKYKGDRYVGEYKDGKKHGIGTYTHASGNKYVGEYKNGKRNGQGTYTFVSGDKYIGELRDSTFSGQGTYYFASGNKYAGEYKDSKPNGQGTYTFADGRRYVGGFKGGVLNGYAIQYRADGSIIKEGVFKDDKFLYASKDPNKSDLPACPSSGYLHNCFGTYTFDSNSKWAGDKYVGEFRDNTYHGQGTYTHASGNKYVGEFRGGERNGQGTFYFLADDEFKGDKYVGEFRDSEKNGQGTYIWADGSRDVGEFKGGVLNGYAIQYRADGSIIKEGVFKDDKFLYAQKVTPEVPVVKAPKASDEIISASSGSGFAVSSDGYVITNYHVVEGCEKVVVHTKDKDLPMRVITYDPKNDLALLKGDFRPKTVFALSNNSPELLQDVYVAGFPFGDKFSTSIKVTKGIVSSLTGLGNNFSNIQIDAALQSGNSGGPILDDFGNVVGVAVAKLDAKYMFDEFGIIPENTNFGIKSSVVRSVLESNNVDSPSANKLSISKSQLGNMISNGTYYISCWMTMAQIDKMKSKKVFFNNLD
ncbi:trypsin-like peptidase domain-containing protein [Alphaproteobacteria bacterium]|nr:trypsin-like peptidase domain-containing protein [Alphaproteobacteria bacterium]